MNETRKKFEDEKIANYKKQQILAQQKEEEILNVIVKLIFYINFRKKMKN